MRTLRLVSIFAFIAALHAFAGGPLLPGGPGISGHPFGTDGKPFTWNPAAMPIQYRVDPGPLSTNAGSAVISNTDGINRVSQMFAIWQGVSTASVSFANAGNILPTGSYTGGDVSTLAQYNDVEGSCKSATQNPVVFDADGSLMKALGLPDTVIGFAGPCAVDSANGFFTAAQVVLNGKFQDGVLNPTATPPNYELSANEFDEAITHELGHFLGLDHSQINLDILTSYTYPCDVDSLAGLPLMFPEELCQARKDAGLPTLSPDDVAWISKLYPNANFTNNYATISGTIYFSDGVSPVQGANVIARLVDDPTTPQDESRRVAVSSISGYLFTGNPGQSVTAKMSDARENNSNGSVIGSRNTQWRGYYEISVPPGTYTVEVESIYGAFSSDSSIGPLTITPPLPGPAEFWNQNESAYDFPLQRDTITVHPGDKVTGINIILNNTQPTFDQFEDSGHLLDPPLPELLRAWIEEVRG